MLLVIALTATTITPAYAHPDLETQIQTLTQQINTGGATTEALTERADLFRRHAQFDDALADLSAVERLTNAPLDLPLMRAQVLCDAGRSRDALAEVDKFLKSAPTNSQAIIIRARCESRLGRREAAIRDFTTAIQHSPAPGPDLYLERARQQVFLGRLDDAVHGLDEVIAQANDASPIVLTAIEYDRQRNAFDSAIRRVNRLIERYPVKEPWLTLRGEIQAQAGRKMEAEADFREVLAGIEIYSAERRSLELTQRLAARVKNNLAQILITNGVAPHP